MDAPLTALILAGGLGTRLRSVVSELPKCMAPVAGRPFLEHILDQLVAQNFSQVCFSVGYLSDSIQNHFGQNYKNLKIIYHIESSPLGTGGAIAASISYLLEQKLVSSEMPLFILNGDSYLKLDYSILLNSLKAETDLIIAAKFMNPADRYGLLQTENNKCTGFLEKKNNSQGLINAGIYLLRASLLKKYNLLQTSGKTFSWETDFLQKNVSKLNISVCPFEGTFIDIGIPEDYQRAQKMF